MLVEKKMPLFVGQLNETNMNLFKVFIHGVLYFFALGDNPVAKFQKTYKSKGDAERINQDWVNVGNDIRRAYDKYQPTGTAQG